MTDNTLSIPLTDEDKKDLLEWAFEHKVPVDQIPMVIHMMILEKLHQ